MTSRRSNLARGSGAGSAFRLFRVRRRGRAIIELTKRTVAMEKALQALLEWHLPALLDVHLVASEYPTGARHEGRIDTLGIDRNGVPVVIEYKRTLSANLISQGLFYLDWLDDHRAEFRMLVNDRLGPDVAKSISWDAPRLMCIAAEFHPYDVRAVRQNKCRIELVRYSWFDDLLLLAKLSAQSKWVMPGIAGSLYVISETSIRSAPCDWTKAPAHFSWISGKGGMVMWPSNMQA